MDLSVERGSDVPVGTQLAWKLRAAIASGSLRPGDRLPAVRELAAAAGVNVNTARAVYARLADQGVIVSEHGRGTFVADGRPDQAGLREVAERAAADARRLGVDPRELAAHLYADAPSRPDAATAGTRRTLRSEIEELEHELARLDAQLGKQGERPSADARRPIKRTGGARLLEAPELERVRDRLAAQVSDRRKRLANASASAPEEKDAEARATREAASPWPELMFSRGPALGNA